MSVRGYAEWNQKPEALTPPELSEVISGAIEEHLDMETYEALLAEEQDVRADLLARLDR